jgi:hypothetical protein
VLAEADMRAFGRHSGFDPKQPLGRIQNNSGPAQGLSRSGRDKLPFQ